MKLFFEGATGTVTGSCSRLEYSCSEEKYQILVDCGLLQEAEEGKISVPEWRFNPSEISCVLLTHAHIDHCGALPLLYNQGFTGKVYATDATIELSKIMLADVAKTTGFFETDDIKKIRWVSIDSIEDGRNLAQYFPILPNIRTCFIRSSHILGACAIYLQWLKNVPEESDNFDKKDKNNYKTILFSGDIGRNFEDINPESTFIKPNFYPFTTTQKEIFVIESTYGNRTHAQNTDYYSKLDTLEKTLKNALSGNGYAVIPAFALDRTQTILGDLFDVLKFRLVLEKNEIDETAINDEIKKIRSDTSITGKERKEKIAPLQKKLSKNKKIQVHSISPLGNKINQVYAKNLGLSSKFMDSNGKIRFRYLNRLPFIPDGYINELNQNTSATKKDLNVKERTSCLLSNDFSKKEWANAFLFKNDNMYGQKKVDGKLQNIPIDPCNFISPRSIIVGASGMCNQGFIQEVVERALRDENATIILTGYTPKDTTGDVIKRFVNGAENAGFTKQELFNTTVPSTKVRLYEIKAKIVDLSDFYSAHADCDEVLTYIFDNPSRPRSTAVQVFLNHGSVAAGLALSKRIDAFNARLSKKAGKTIVTSPFCRSFDITGDEIVNLESEENVSEHEKLLSDTEKLLLENNGEAERKSPNTTEEIIKRKILENKEFLFAGTNTTDIIVSRIKEIVDEKSVNLSDELVQEKIRNEFSRWWNWKQNSSETSLNNFSSPGTTFLKTALSKNKLFDAEKFKKLLCDYKNRFEVEIPEQFSDSEKEIERLNKEISVRKNDELLKDMPFTRSIPHIIDRQCKNYLSSLLESTKTNQVFAAAQKYLAEFSVFQELPAAKEKK